MTFDIIGFAVKWIFLLLYSVSSLKFSEKIFTDKKASNITRAAICIAGSIVATAAIIYLPLFWAYIVIYVSMFAAYMIMWHTSGRLVLYLINAYILNIMIVQTVVKAMMALVMGVTVSRITYSTGYLWDISIGITCVLLFAATWAVSRLVPTHKIRAIEGYSDLRRGMNIFMGMCNFYMLLQCTAFGNDTSLGSAIVFNQLLMCVLLLFANWAFLFYNMRIILLLGYKKDHEHLNELRDALMANAAYKFEFNLEENFIITSDDSAAPNFLGRSNSYSDFIKNLFKLNVHSSDSERLRKFLSADNLKSVREKGEDNVYMDFRIRNGGVKYSWFRINTAVFLDKTTGQHYGYIYISNIEEEMREKEKLEQAAHTDGLTGLLNKVTTIGRINRDIINGGVLFVIDVDNFKHTNDTLGHASGDAVLGSISNNIKTVFRRGDIMGRFGGDEFIVFMQLDENLKNIAENRAKELCLKCRTSYTAADGSVQPISISIGAVTVEKNICDGFEKAFNIADSALYQSKRLGKNTYKIIDMAQTGA